MKKNENKKGAKRGIHALALIRTWKICNFCTKMSHQDRTEHNWIPCSTTIKQQDTFQFLIPE